MRRSVLDEELDLDERNLLRDFCKAALERSRYVTTSGIYQVFDSETEPQKLDVAESLQYKGYIKIETKDPMYSLLPKGVEYCNKYKSQRSAIFGLKEKRGKFIRDFYDLLEGDDSRLVFDQELYSFGETHGYTRDEIYSLALHFDGLGLMKAEPVLGRRIAVLRLTPIGTRYIEEGEKGLEHQYYSGLERQYSDREIKLKATAKSTILEKPCVFASSFVMHDLTELRSESYIASCSLTDSNRG